MRRVAASVAVLVVLLVPASAGAVTITEFPLPAVDTTEDHGPGSLAAGGDGNLWVLSGGPGAGVSRVTTNGLVIGSFPAQQPVDIAVGPSGDVYWTDSRQTATPPGYEGGIVRGTPSGATTPFMQEGGIAIGLAVEAGAAGDHVVYSSSIRAVSSVCSFAFATITGGGCGPVTGAPPLMYDMAFASDGRLWATGYSSDILVRLTPGFDAVDATLAVPTGSTPQYIALGPDGNLWATMSRANAIDRITPAGARTRFPLAPGRAPYDITAGPDGALWFTESSAIGRITTTGHVDEFPVPTAGSRPHGITVGPDGAIWFTEYSANQLGRLRLDPPGSAGARGGQGGPGVVTDRAAPVFTKGLSLSRSRFRASAAARRPAPRGSEFRFSLSEPARVAIAIARATPGRRVGGRCVKATRSNRRRARCTRFVSVGTLRRDGRQGANSIPFSGRVNGRGLHGTYRATAVATDRAGNESKPSRATFTVVTR
jgi:sugar lactone lactonase YvrE